MSNSRNGILESAVKQSVEKLAEKGVDGCTTKDVILACMGGIYGNTAATRSDVRKFGWAIVSSVFTVLVAIIIVLIFIP